VFADARAAASRALEQLRLLAHGIHPGILTGAGLEEALISYAATATPSPRLAFDLGGHLPEDIESALYAIVTALVDSAGTASATSVSIRRDGDSVRVIVENRDHAPEYVLDRLGAAGGSSVIAEHRLELVLPCA
jgi:signal transduction histidine kinase